MRLEVLEDRQLLCGDVAETPAVLAEATRPPLGSTPAEFAAHPAAAFGQIDRMPSRGRTPHQSAANPSAARLTATTPSIAVSDAAGEERHSGQTALVFTVSLSAPSSKVVSVSYSTANGSAKTGDGDFVGKSGNLTFTPGETTKTIAVLVNGDAKLEENETFFVSLRRARNAQIADAQGMGTILNDDSPPPPPADDGGGLPCSPGSPCGDPPPSDAGGGGGW